MVHAISSGFDPASPKTAPNTFFSFFDEARVPIEYVGLFTEAIVPCVDYQALKTRVIVKESFERAGEIELVVTSLASATSEGILSSYREHMAWQEDFVGDVQFCPYSWHGPLPQDSSDPDVMRAVTLFEIEDFVRMVQDGRYVLLISGPTKKGTKADALLPLLQQENLRVASHLCLDTVTAREVMATQVPDLTV